jgi:TetR/AcrR family transcriptional regulator
MNDTSRDAEKTRERILSAAEALFAERGFAGTSISAISRLSGCSGPLILFHFQDKRGLYRAVQSAIIDRYNEFLPEPVEQFVTLEGFLAYLLRTMFRYYERNPAMIRIANWRRLEGDNEP